MHPHRRSRQARSRDAQSAATEDALGGVTVLHVLRPHSSPALEGSPAEAFYTRCQLRWARRWRLGSWLVLVANVLLLLRTTRGPAERPPAAHWLLVGVFVALLEIVFTDKPPGYLHWREVPTAILRLSSIPTLGLIRQLLDAHAPPLPAPQAAGALEVLAAGTRAHLAHWALLVYASGLILPSATSICLRMRFSLSVAVQVVQLAAAELATPGMCATAALAHPAAQRLTAQQYYGLGAAALHWLPRALAAPWAGAPRPASPAEQCAALLRLHRLVFGFGVPVCCELLMKSRIFHMHQTQRQEAGLAPERGVHALLFETVYKRAWPRFLRK